MKVRGSLSEPLCGARTHALPNRILESEKVTLLHWAEGCFRPRGHGRDLLPSAGFCVRADGLGQKRSSSGAEAHSAFRQRGDAAWLSLRVNI